jgi:glycogen(starch) synthase
MDKTHMARTPEFREPILFVGPYPPVIGGTSAMLRRLIPALEESGVPCRILNTKVGNRQGGLFERLGRLAFFKLLGLKAMFAREKLVHCHTVNFANLLGHAFVLLFCRLAGKRTVITLHAGDLHAKLSSGRSRAIGSRILKMAHVITTVTPELAELCQELGMRHAVFISNDLRYTPHGGDGKELPPVVEEFIAGHDPVVTLVGAMKTPYGIDVFLKATRELRKTHPRAGALIIAFKSETSVYYEEMLALREELGLADVALIPDEFPNVAEALRRSDVFVRPTLSDGDSIAVREALTLGLPVVASNVGFRPAGVKTFPVGDHAGLAAAISETIGEIMNGEKPEPVVSEESERRTLGEFVDAFRVALK